MSSIESSGKRRFIAALFWLLIIGAALAFVFLWWKPFSKAKLNEETGSESQYKTEVRVRADSFNGYCILRSPEMKNQLKRHGVKFTVQDDKADYLNRMKALHAGKADMAVFTVDSLLTAGAKTGDFPVSMVLVIDESRGADAVVSYKKAVASIHDLNKPNAGFVATPDSPSEFLARVVVADFSLPRLPEKWLTPAEGAAAVYAEFKKASRTEPKAFVLWEPYVSMALSDPEAHILFSSEKLKNCIIDVLAVRRQFLKDSPEIVRLVIESYLRAAYSYKDGMEDLVIDDAKAAGETLSREDAKRVVNGIRWKNTLENYAHFRLIPRQEMKGLEDMEDIVGKIANILQVTGAAKGTGVEHSSLFCNKTLAALQSAGFHPEGKLGLVQGSDTGGDIGEIKAEAELPQLSDDGWKKLMPVGQMRIEPISFLRGTSDLSIQSRRDLEELAKTLKSMPSYYMTVVGHARMEGDRDANMQLADERAKVAAEYLVLRLGISRNRMRAVASEPSGGGGAAQSVSFELGQMPY